MAPLKLYVVFFTPQVPLDKMTNISWKNYYLVYSKRVMFPYLDAIGLVTWFHKLELENEKVNEFNFKVNFQMLRLLLGELYWIYKPFWTCINAFIL